ncbi:hypothetical protein CASFOL_035030 [Castilleja foliolosa]|uniref:Replication factor A C-terminal domain-containing protein n=1 Tax=Castilleja foliolosa TaxID=1961234 RepID=A0ABD3BSB9_9LAMI
MELLPAFTQEFNEIYSEISTRRAIFRSLHTLKEMREDVVYWVEGTITGVETEREFCYLACRVCDKQVEEIGDKKRCLSCGEFTFRNKYRYNIEVTVADESDSAKMILWNRSSEKLIGEVAEDIIGLYGDTARIMPDEIAAKILGKEGLFEVVVSSENLHADGFNVSRLTIDDEIKDVYLIRNYPATYEENHSSLEQDVEDAESVTKDEAAEIDGAEIEAETSHTAKRQKVEGTIS